tara:strand:+ start:1445 stop:1597 length:153 start_codon:yes stop_codon:yes gene_type:complete
VLSDKADTGKAFLSAINVSSVIGVMDSPKFFWIKKNGRNLTGRLGSRLSE